MPRPFATHYDALYADKDYGKDVADFRALLGDRPLSGLRLLEIGAGTGSHTVRLAPEVAELVSVEIDPDFAALLRARLASGAFPHVTTFAGRVEELPARPFDAAAAFFHVLNYVPRASMPGFLEAIARRLVPGAPFVADLWNGEAALRDPPRDEVREKRVADVRIVQRIRPHLDAPSRSVTLDYDVALESPSSRDAFSERLELFLWFCEELRGLLHSAGFAQVEFRDYRAFPAAATPDSWRLWMRAVRSSRTGG